MGRSHSNATRKGLFTQKSCAMIINKYESGLHINKVYLEVFFNSSSNFSDHKKSLFQTNIFKLIKEFAMKKLWIIVLVLLMSVSLCSCGDKPQSSPAGNTNDSASANNVVIPNSDAAYRVDQVFFRTFQGSDGEHFQASLRITNTGKAPLFLTNATWELKDSSGNSITAASVQPATMGYPQVVYEGEASWYYINALVEKMTNGSADIANAEPKFYIKDFTSNLYENIDFGKYPVSDLRLEETDGKLIAFGTVENYTDESSYYLLVYVRLYDKDGHLVGMLSAYTDPLSPGEKQSFTAEYNTSWNSGELSLALSDIASFDAVASYLRQK